MIIKVLKMKQLIFLFLFSALSLTAETIKVACVGDSITYGARVEEREKNNWPKQLGNLLGDKYDVQNFGVNGATMLQKGNLPYWKTKQYQSALALKPNIVFIKLGTNDSKKSNWKHSKEYIADYKKMIASFQALESKPRIILLVPIPAFVEGSNISATRVKKEVIPKVRQIAYSENLELIDLYQVFINRPEELPDKLHPNAKGATRIANHLKDYLERKTTDFTPKIDGSAFNFHGFKGLNFKIENDIACKVVFPKKVNPEKRWIWRARFFGHEPQLDIALLERGFHVAYCEVGSLFGSPKAVERWNKFYTYFTGLGFHSKVVIEGMSRGGLISYNWAKANPDKVSCIYADAPVCNITSWPGGKGVGKGSAGDWKKAMAAYEFTEEQAMAFKGNPIDGLEVLAKAGVPLIHVCGADDKVVPMSENTDILAKRYKELGGKIEVISKPGIGHHPHSLPNPEVILKFILENGLK